MNTSDITDEQIETLRTEAGAAGDELMVAICDVALAGGLTDDVPASAEAHKLDLERRGIYAWSVQGSDQARAECARVLADAEVAS